ncbi:MAG: hypothetical protein HY537_07000 [Deltaproteobacteria bacterium]|nr:hypothetical protein [Deltaproteobacteria bacterium]
MKKFLFILILIIGLILSGCAGRKGGGGGGGGGEFEDYSDEGGEGEESENDADGHLFHFEDSKPDHHSRAGVAPQLPFFPYPPSPARGSVSLPTMDSMSGLIKSSQQGLKGLFEKAPMSTLSGGPTQLGVSTAPPSSPRTFQAPQIPAYLPAHQLSTPQK